MNIIKNETNIILLLDERIDSSNAPKLLDEALKELDGLDKGTNIIFDLVNTKYLSSAGLRMILAVKQKFTNTIVKNASKDVYDVFEMTGFTEMMDIARALREISTEGLEKIGEGAVGAIYRLTKDEIVKVFKFDLSMEDIKREIDMTKQAFLYGVPTTISYDIVKVVDKDKYGLVMELMNSHSICKQIIASPDKLDYYANMMAELMIDVHSKTVPECIFNDQLVLITRYLNGCTKYLTVEEISKIKKMFDNLKIKDRLIHGDFHIKNVMTQNGEPVLIDLDSMSRGNPIIDYATIYCSYYMYPETDKGNVESFFGIPESDAHKLYHIAFDKAFGNRSDKQAIQDKIVIVAAIEIIYNVVAFEYDNNIARVNNALKYLRELLPKYDDLEIYE